MNLLFDKETYEIRGAVFDVYNELGHGFLESVYQESLEIELLNRNIPFNSKFEIGILYKGKKL